jgi:MATE family multidrug resistance protein
MGALRGYKDTRVPLLIMIIAYWVVGMPLGYNISLTDNIIEPIGALGMWIGMAAGMFILSILVLWRLNLVSKNSTQFQQSYESN